MVSRKNGNSLLSSSKQLLSLGKITDPSFLPSTSISRRLTVLYTARNCKKSGHLRTYPPFRDSFVSDPQRDRIVGLGNLESNDESNRWSMVVVVAGSAYPRRSVRFAIKERQSNLRCFVYFTVPSDRRSRFAKLKYSWESVCRDSWPIYRCRRFSFHRITYARGPLSVAVNLTRG